MEMFGGLVALSILALPNYVGLAALAASLGMRSRRLAIAGVVCAIAGTVILVVEIVLAFRIFGYNPYDLGVILAVLIVGCVGAALWIGGGLFWVRDVRRRLTGWIPAPPASRPPP